MTDDSAVGKAAGTTVPSVSRRNLLEKRALRRAATRLPLLPGEEPLEFDIGQSEYSRMPGFYETDFSRSKRIDLVATDRALYAHCGGRTICYPYQEILKCWLAGATTLRGNFLFWLLRDGLRAQVYVGAQRPLASFVGDRLARFETALADAELDQRARLRAKYAGQDDQRTRLEQALEGCDWHWREFKGAIRSADGLSSVAGSVSATFQGVTFDDRASTHVIVPYGAIRTSEIADDQLNAEIEERAIARFRSIPRHPWSASQSFGEIERELAELEKCWRAADSGDVMLMSSALSPNVPFASFEVRATGRIRITQWAALLQQFKSAEAGSGASGAQEAR